MKYEIAVAAFAGLASARHVPLYSVKREVPQEHSHNAILANVKTSLDLNNPLAIQDSVFGLLGNKAAAEGAPNVQNLDCLQQIIADQAFTNAKAAGDALGEAMAVMFRALERNTASVGLASVTCNQTAVNPEIAAIQQHQDPASTAASGNKQIELNVAQQLAALGQDPTLALQTGTFAAGKIGDPTAAGNTCDVADDTVGCIISQNLLVSAASSAEIATAVAGVAQGGAGAAAVATRAVNVQTFTGTLGGAAPPVESTAGSARPFSVDGSTFVNSGAALQRSCSVQANACSNAANSGSISGGTAQCNTQEAACNAASSAARKRSGNMRRAADFGSCGSPAIEFAAGLDGRTEEAFQAVDQADFNHGSADKIGVVANFNCGQLQGKCAASAATVATCQSAATAASALTGQAAADAFNSALGVTA